MIRPYSKYVPHSNYVNILSFTSDGRLDTYLLRQLQRSLQSKPLMLKYKSSLQYMYIHFQ